MSENAKGRNHPQSPRKRIALRIGTGRGRQARGYDSVNKVWTHSKKRAPKL